MHARKLSTAAALLLFCATTRASAQDPPSNQQENRLKLGPYVTLIGPNSAYGLGFAVQPISALEASLWYGHNRASGSAVGLLSTASASITVNTFLARARVWTSARHAFLIDGGIGATSYKVSADGKDILANTISYTRDGTMPLANLGVGYGFRTQAGFRLAILIGPMFHLGSLKGSSVSTTGAFTESDRNTLKTNLDTITNDLAKPRGYLDFSLGWMF